MPLVALAERRSIWEQPSGTNSGGTRSWLGVRCVVELVGVDAGVGAVRRRGLRRRAAAVGHRAGIAVERLRDAGSLGLGQARRKLDVEAHDEAAPGGSPRARATLSLRTVWNLIGE